jgi:transcription elongation GreA/GreB family factor
MANVGLSKVSVGSVVRVRWTDQLEEDQFTIVPDHEADVTLLRVAASAPFARAVIGHVAGDRVAVRGVDHRYAVTIVAVDVEGDVGGRGRPQ